ncbi:MAG: DUF475 domain-containing protein [Bacteroidetes bacterium]|nr:DUF475 domain-containing protein [Bacteroidota bacterium]
MDFLTEFLSPFLQPDPKTAALVVLNLVLIESLLSIDNAAVLATMVMDLPKEKRSRALKYGILGAYVFRGLALFFASELIKINWLKLAGGAYLLYLTGHFFYKRIGKEEHILDIQKGELDEKIKHPKTIPGLNHFWSVVVMVELMNLTFSIDNVFAAVAFTDNIFIICTGVFIGILSMRIVAGYFVKLMERLPFLDSIAYLVIGVLGLRLCLEFACHYTPDFILCRMLEAENADMYFSIFTVSLFVLPILYHLIFRKKT